jgi:hypothetical protein
MLPHAKSNLRFGSGSIGNQKFKIQNEMAEGVRLSNAFALVGKAN